MWTKGFGGKHAGKSGLLPLLTSFTTAREGKRSRLPSRRHHIHQQKHMTNAILGGGIVIDKHGARRAPFRFSFKGLNCFK
jgi:hypothetical protein